MSNVRYLLVKACVGFGDRLQCLSHAIQYAAKYQRVLCVDWGDAVWSDGSIDFHTYFDICGVPMISTAELFSLPIRDIYPLGWSNQLDRAADLKFVFKEEYVNPLEDRDHSAELLVYASTGYRLYHANNLCTLRVKRDIRNQIVEQLKRYSPFETVVHLRGTDRVPAEKHAEYVSQMCEQMQGVSRQERVLVVSDCLPLFVSFQREFPSSVLRTPHLGMADPHIGTHRQTVLDKRSSNLELLVDFFLLMYAQRCFRDKNTIFSQMARFIHEADYTNILGYDPPPR